MGCLVAGANFLLKVIFLFKDSSYAVNLYVSYFVVTIYLKLCIILKAKALICVFTDEIDIFVCFSF